LITLVFRKIAEIKLRDARLRPYVDEYQSIKGFLRVKITYKR